MMIKIPEKPVDGFRVDWWTFNYNYMHLNHRWAIFHKSTPYSKVDAAFASEYGVPFVNEFAIYLKYGGSDEPYRIEGRADWNHVIKNVLTEGNVMTDRIEAFEKLKERILMIAEQHEVDAALCRRRLKEL